MSNSDSFQTGKRHTVLCILLGIAGGAIWAFSSGNYLLLIGLVLSGIAVFYLERWRQENGFKDERIQQIYFFTSWATLQFSISFFAFGGALFISFRNLYPQYSSLGFHLAYISCGVCLLYTLFHIYFCKKYGV